MAGRLMSAPLSHTAFKFLLPSSHASVRPISTSSSLLHCPTRRSMLIIRRRWRRSRSITTTVSCVQVEQPDESAAAESKGDWGKVSAVLFDMDGVLCNSEEPSRRAAVDVFAEMGVEVTVEDFVPYMGTGEANFLGGVASAKGVKGFNTDAAKKRFFEIYLEKYAKPNSGIGFPGALELISQCKENGLKVSVASSADRIKVDANLAAAGLPPSLFDAIVSADAFEKLKPAPDIFLAASKILGVPTSECIVIEDALAGLQAAKAANMRCIVVTTTLSEEALSTAGPSLIRKDIGDISLDDITNGGSEYRNESMQGSEHVHTSELSLSRFKESSESAFSSAGLQTSRQDVVRYGSLAISVSCLVFTITNWKAMQFASPKALWNMIFGVGSPSFESKEGEPHNARIQLFVNYISDLETRANAATIPEFPSRLDWLNTTPLRFSKDLKGKVVLLDFWTYCCINCMHVLPDLEFLEKKYKDMPFVVIGVHSAKFDNEKDSEAIRNAVLRYGVTHPVVNDGDMFMWRELGVNSWPTFAVVGPNGRLLAQLAGEGHRKDLDDLVEAALIFYGEKNMLNNTSLPLRLEKDNDPRLLSSPLKFPGKLSVDLPNNRLFISDSNHNRIVVTDLNGNYILQVGSTGEEGLRDGTFDNATFNRPQGLAYNMKRNVLYVADTENHALREIDFVNEKVRTLAGNGIKGSDYGGGGKGNTQLLNSPWDACYHPVIEKVYIAMAGQHQIWEHDIMDETTRAFSGDGYERNLNGSRPTNTSFAQPSGLSLSPDLKELYVADSESSSIRVLDLETGGSRLIAGGDPVLAENLFKFGDRDGTTSEVLLQHPLGVCCGQSGQVFVADSYNHKIKLLDPKRKQVVTLAGTGKAGFKDGNALIAQLSEPSGIVEIGQGKILVADTNNSVIRYIDLNQEVVQVQTLELKGIQPPAPKSRTLRRLRRRLSSDTQVIKVNGSPSRDGDLYLKISLPSEYHFSKEARSKFFIDVEPDDSLMVEPVEGALSSDGSAVVHFKRLTSSSSLTRINCKVYYCKEDEICLYQSVEFEVPIVEEVPDSPPAEIKLEYFVKPKYLQNSLPLTVAS